MKGRRPISCVSMNINGKHSVQKDNKSIQVHSNFIYIILSLYLSLSPSIFLYLSLSLSISLYLSLSLAFAFELKKCSEEIELPASLHTLSILMNHELKESWTMEWKLIYILIRQN